jgi:hypothetical protein
MKVEVIVFGCLSQNCTSACHSLLLGHNVDSTVETDVGIGVVD